MQGLLLWWAVKYHLGDGFMFSCCWSFPLTEPEPWRVCSYAMCSERFAQPEPVHCWLLWPECADLLRFPCSASGIFFFISVPEKQFFWSSFVCAPPWVCMAGWWIGDVCIPLSPLVSEPLDFTFQGSHSLAETQGVLLRVGYSVLCCLESLEKFFGNLIKLSDENSGSLFPRAKLPFSASSLLLGFPC